MIRARCKAVAALDVAISPPFADRAKAVMARSISTASRTSIGPTSTLSDGAIAWMTPNWAIPEEFVGSRRTATRLTSGAISLSSSSHLPLRLYSVERKPVALLPGRARLSTIPAPTGSPTKDNRHGAGCLPERPNCRDAMGEDDIRRERNQFGRVSANVVGIDSSPANVDPQVAADGPAEFLQLLLERSEPCLIFRSVRGCGQEHADAPHPAALLRARRERPCCRRAAKQCDERAPPHGHPRQAQGRTLHAVAEERRCASQQKLRANVADGSRSEELDMSTSRPLLSPKRPLRGHCWTSHSCQPTSTYSISVRVARTECRHHLLQIRS